MPTHNTHIYSSPANVTTVLHCSMILLEEITTAGIIILSKYIRVEVYVAPDWVIEILSPNQSSNRVMANIAHCLKFGWLIQKIDFDDDARSGARIIPRR